MILFIILIYLLETPSPKPHLSERRCIFLTVVHGPCTKPKVGHSRSGILRHIKRPQTEIFPSSNILPIDSTCATYLRHLVGKAKCKAQYPWREFGPPAMTLPDVVLPPRPKINYFCDDDILEMHGEGIVSEPIPCDPPVDCDGMFDRQSDRYQRCQLIL